MFREVLAGIGVVGFGTAAASACRLPPIDILAVSTIEDAPAVAAAAPPTDGRVRYGDLMISRPWETVSSVSKADPTLIPIPDNTLGPGEPLWAQSDRLSAERRINESDAVIAEREAAATVFDVSRGQVYVTGGYWGGAYYGPSHAYIGRAPFGAPPLSTTYHSDLTPGQQGFYQASYPRIAPLINSMQQTQIDLYNRSHPAAQRTVAASRRGPK